MLSSLALSYSYLTLYPKRVYTDGELFPLRSLSMYLQVHQMSSSTLENLASFFSRYVPFPAKEGAGASIYHEPLSSTAISMHQPASAFDSSVIRIAGLSGSLAVVIGAYGAHGSFFNGYCTLLHGFFHLVHEPGSHSRWRHVYSNRLDRSFCGLLRCLASCSRSMPND